MRGAEHMFNESPKVAEGERFWQPQVPHGSNLRDQLLPVETDQFPLGAPAVRPGEQGCNTTPRETARWLEGLRSSVSIQDHHAVHLSSVSPLSWLFCVGEVQRHIIPGLVHSLVTCYFQGLLRARQHYMPGRPSGGSLKYMQLPWLANSSESRALSTKLPWRQRVHGVRCSPLCHVRLGMAMALGSSWTVCEGARGSKTASFSLT